MYKLVGCNFCDFIGPKKSYYKHYLLYHTNLTKCIYCNRQLPKLLLTHHVYYCTEFNESLMYLIPPSTSKDYSYNIPNDI